MNPPQRLGPGIAGPDGEAVMERRQRPVKEAAVLFQTMLRRFFVNRLEPLGGAADHEPEGAGKNDQHQGMDPERQHRQPIQKRHRDEHRCHPHRRPQAGPQPFPHQGGARHTEKQAVASLPSFFEGNAGFGLRGGLRGIFTAFVHSPASRRASLPSASQPGSASRASMSSTVMRSRTTAKSPSLTIISGTRGRVL